MSLPHAKDKYRWVYFLKSRKRYPTSSMKTKKTVLIGEELKEPLNLDSEVYGQYQRWWPRSLFSTFPLRKSLDKFCFLLSIALIVNSRGSVILSKSTLFLPFHWFDSVFVYTHKLVGIFHEWQSRPRWPCCLLNTLIQEDFVPGFQLRPLPSKQKHKSLVLHFWRKVTKDDLPLSFGKSHSNCWERSPVPNIAPPYGVQN